MIEIADSSAPELDVYARLTEAQLRNVLEPERGIFIAESPKVIRVALDMGYQPLSFLMERRHIEGDGAELIARCPGCRFTVFPAEGLAGAVERWLLGGVPLRLGDHLPAGKFDGVVLGCTHFVFLRKEIAEYYRAPVFDGGEGVANRLKTVLFDRSRKIEGIGSHECLELDNRRIPPNSFQKTTKNAIIFLGSSKNANKCVYKQMFDNIFPYNSTKKCKKT